MASGGFLGSAVVVGIAILLFLLLLLLTFSMPPTYEVCVLQCGGWFWVYPESESESLDFGTPKLPTLFFWV